MHPVSTTRNYREITGEIRFREKENGTYDCSNSLTAELLFTVGATTAAGFSGRA